MPLWGYLLGVWLIGPFPTQADCEAARRYQLTNGGVEAEVIGACHVLSPPPQELRKLIWED